MRRALPMTGVVVTAHWTLLNRVEALTGLSGAFR